MAGVLGVYDYTYGAGDQCNRQIQFVRPSGPESVQAHVFVMQNGVLGERTSIVSGGNITVEMENTTSKMLKVARGLVFNLDQRLSALTAAGQDIVIRSFPDRKIEISSGPGEPGRQEVVTNLLIFDPN